MPTIFRVLLSLAIFAFGLVLAAVMLVSSVLLLAARSVQRLWLKFTGRARSTIASGLRRRAASRTPRRRAAADVTDVEARPLP